MKNIEDVVNKLMPMLEKELTSESKSGTYGPALLTPSQKYPDGNQFDLVLFEEVYLSGKIERPPTKVGLLLASLSAMQLSHNPFAYFPIFPVPEFYDNATPESQSLEEKPRKEGIRLVITPHEGYRYLINLDDEMNIIDVLPRQIKSGKTTLELSDEHHLYLANKDLVTYIRQELRNLSLKR